MPRICNVGGVRPLPSVPVILNVTNGNGTGTKNVLKWNRALGFEFGIQSSVYKPILYLDTGYCKFLLYVSVEIDPFSYEQKSAI